MSRPPESNHPLLPWVIPLVMGAVGFVGGALSALLIAVPVSYGVGYPRRGIIMSMASLERVEALMRHPLFGSVILAAGIAAAIWAALIARKTLNERQQQKS